MILPTAPASSQVSRAAVMLKLSISSDSMPPFGRIQRSLCFEDEISSTLEWSEFNTTHPATSRAPVALLKIWSLRPSRAASVFWNDRTLSLELHCATSTLHQAQDVVLSDWTFDVSDDGSGSVVQELNSDLGDTTSGSGSTKNLDDFSKSDWSFRVLKG
ncbi:hypothetical protein OGAPHI_001842 [Ogataea philodendri]|uniref:Uncharacterized protein n=1 Tax=Ogataea philodendri TaxID=1378263 RepID=A0A9P8T6H3_9ASCO|nr:uncharacterized protein OGAPHI_001842 [Ogataea philodendri]KAH3668088.1 hypothetical protein OGAPHI_001842 [Ogataea philodendri]